MRWYQVSVTYRVAGAVSAEKLEALMETAMGVMGSPSLGAGEDEVSVTASIQAKDSQTALRNVQWTFGDVLRAHSVPFEHVLHAEVVDDAYVPVLESRISR